MSNVNYRFNVDKLQRSASNSFTVASNLVIDKTVTLDYSTGTSVSLTFDGFTLKLDPDSPSTQMSFALSKPGHPMNGNSPIAWGMIMISNNSSDVFHEYELTIPISNDEKLAIRLDKI